MISQPSCYTEKIRLARKAHSCCECGYRIQPREKYLYVSGIWDGEPADFKMDLNCADLVKKARLECVELELFYEDGPAIGHLKSWVHEYTERDGTNLMAEAIGMKL